MGVWWFSAVLYSHYSEFKIINSNKATLMLRQFKQCHFRDKDDLETLKRNYLEATEHTQSLLPLA